jgi:hypothetical protein
MSEAAVTHTATHTADTPQLLLEHHLKELRLPTILREYDKVARQRAVEQVDYARYLLRMTELELLDRERPGCIGTVFERRGSSPARGKSVGPEDSRRRSRSAHGKLSYEN